MLSGYWTSVSGIFSSCLRFMKAKSSCEGRGVALPHLQRYMKLVVAKKLDGNGSDANS